MEMHLIWAFSKYARRILQATKMFWNEQMHVGFEQEAPR